jgi:hypothetical protein
MSIHAPFIILFIASLFIYFLNYSMESWTQTASEFESKFIFGKITAVNDNFSIGINDSLVVSLALVDTNTATNQTSHEDLIHFMSVVCPIRSPVVVLPVPDSINSLEHDSKSANLTDIQGVLYCQASNISDINSTKSINEQLVIAKLATLDSKNCNSQTCAHSLLTRLGDY